VKAFKQNGRVEGSELCSDADGRRNVGYSPDPEPEVADQHVGFCRSRAAVAPAGEQGEDPEVLEESLSAVGLRPKDSMTGGEMDRLGRVSFPAKRRLEG
jgi:hypothetical protein